MKPLIFFLLTLSVFCQSCSKRNAFDKLIEKQFNQCKNTNSCIVDLSTVITSDWDTMYFFTNAYSLDEIDSILGFHLKEYIDIGDRIVLTKKKHKVVYYQEWFPYPSDEIKNIVIFDTEKKYFVVERKRAVFYICKKNQFYCLKLIE